MKKQPTNAGLKTSGAKVTLTDGFLSILWIDATTYKSLKKRITFRFYSEPPDLLTLHGWSSDSDIYADKPDVILNIGKKTIFQYGNKTYFGNLILRLDDFKKIKRQMKNAFNYVLFVPLDPQDPKQNHQITYDIQLTNDDPTNILPFTSTATGVSLNPSPPRNSN
jgi:hypothetical protein